jgi:chromosome segregation ATPase
MTFYETLNLNVKDLLDVKTPSYTDFERQLPKLSVKVSSEKEALQILEDGVKRRATAETKQNLQSSRSHAIISFHLFLGEQPLSNITFFDLAGSERFSLDEQNSAIGREINSSLSAFQRLILDRAQGAPNFGRENTLARLFALNFDHRTYQHSPPTQLNFIGCISTIESNWMTTHSTLSYTESIKSVKQVVKQQDQTKSMDAQRKINRALLCKLRTIEVSTSLGLHLTDGDEPVNILCRSYEGFDQEALFLNFSSFETVEKEYLEYLQIATNSKFGQIKGLEDKLDKIQIELEKAQKINHELIQQNAEQNQNMEKLHQQKVELIEKLHQEKTQLMEKLHQDQEALTKLHAEELLKSHQIELELKQSIDKLTQTTNILQIQNQDMINTNQSLLLEREKFEQIQTNLTLQNQTLREEHDVQILKHEKLSHTAALSIKTLRALVRTGFKYFQQELLQDKRMMNVQILVTHINAEKRIKTNGWMFSIVAKSILSALSLERNNCKFLSTKINQLSETLSTVQSELTLLQNEHGELIHENGDLIARYEGLDHDMDQLDSEFGELESLKDQIESEKNRLQIQLDQGLTLYNHQVMTLNQSTVLFERTVEPMERAIGGIKEEFLKLATTLYNPDRIIELRSDFPDLNSIINDNAENLRKDNGIQILRFEDENLPKSIQNYEQTYWKALNIIDYAGDVIQFLSPQLIEFANKFHIAYEKLKNEFEAANVEKKQFLAQIATGKTMLANLQARLIQKDEEIAGLNHECDELDAKLVEMDTKFEQQIDESFKKQTSKFEFFQKDLILSQQQSKNFSNELKMTIQRDELLSQIKIQTDLYSDMKNTINQEEKTELLSQISTLEKSNSLLQQTNTDLTTAITQLDSNLAIKSSELDMCKKQLLDTNLNYSKTQEHNTHLTATNSQHLAQITDLKKFKRLYTVQCNEVELYKDQIERNCDELNETRQNVSNLKKIIDSNSVTINTLRNEKTNNELQRLDINQDYENKLNDLEQKVKYGEVLNMTQKNEYSNLLSRFETLQLQFNTLTKRSEEDTLAHRDAITKLEIAVKKCTGLENAIVEKESLCNVLIEKNQNLEQELFDFSTKNKELEAEILSLWVELPAEHTTAHENSLIELNLKYEERQDVFEQKLSIVEGKLEEQRNIISLQSEQISKQEQVIREDEYEKIKFQNEIKSQGVIIDELNNKVNNLITNNGSDLIKYNEQIKEVNQTSQREIKDMNSRNLNLMNVIAAHEATIIKLRADIDIKDNQIQSIKDDVIVIGNKNEELVQKKQAEIEHKKAEIENEKLEFEKKLSLNKNQFESIISQRDESISTLQTVNNELKSNIDSQKVQFEELQTSYDGIVGEMKKNIQHLQQNLIKNDQELHEKMTRFEIDANNTNLIISEHIKQINLLESQKLFLEGQIRADQIKYVELSSQFDLVQKKLHNLDESSQETISSLEIRLEEMNEAKLILEQVNNEMKNTISNYEAKLIELGRQSDEKINQIKSDFKIQIETNIAQSNNTVDSLRLQLKDTDAKLTQLYTELYHTQLSRSNEHRLMLEKSAQIFNFEQNEHIQNKKLQNNSIKMEQIIECNLTQFKNNDTNLKIENNNLIEKMTTIQIENEKSKQQFEEIVVGLNNEIASMKQISDSFSVEIETLKNTILTNSTQLTDEIQHEKASKLIQDEKLSQLQLENEKIISLNAKLEINIRKLQEELETTSASHKCIMELFKEQRNTEIDTIKLQFETQIQQLIKQNEISIQNLQTNFELQKSDFENQKAQLLSKISTQREEFEQTLQRTQTSLELTIRDGFHKQQIEFETKLSNLEEQKNRLLEQNLAITIDNAQVLEDYNELSQSNEMLTAMNESYKDDLKKWERKYGKLNSRF